MSTKYKLWVRLAPGAAFLLMGFSFSVTQTLLVRELLVSFAGNELSIGAVLGSWLLLEAVGSGLVGRLVARKGRGTLTYAGLQVAFALLLIPVLYLVFDVRQLMGATSGQELGLLPILLSSFLLLIPLGLVDGAMFFVGCRMDAELRQSGAGTASRVYIREALGGIIGGVVFTYFFVPCLHSVGIALILMALNLASALSLVLLPSPVAWVDRRCWPRRILALALVLTLVVCLGLLLSPGADGMHQHLVARRWYGYDPVFYCNSVYGNVAATRQQDQFTFFANGLPILTTPRPDIVRVEEMVHLPMLFVSRPRRVLVLSGGLGGVIRELLKYPLERLDYAELDPLLIEAVASLPTPLTEAELRDPRTHIEPVDGRLLVRRLATLSLGGDGPPAYDLILLNLPYPTTLQLNRFYTVEFWRMARSLLADEGIVVLSAPGSLTYLSPGMRGLHNALYATLSEVFPYVRPIPGDVTLWLASGSEALGTARVETLVERWKARGLSSDLTTDFHIRLVLDARRLAWFWEALQTGRPVAINRDLRPSGLLYGLAYWAELFSPELAPYFDLLERVNLFVVAVPALVLVLAGAIVVGGADRRSAPPTRSIPIVIAITGFGGMTADLLIIFAFQVFYGYVYQFIGLLITAFMAGLSLGAWMMARMVHGSYGNPGWHRQRRWLLGLEAALLCFWLVLPIILTLLCERMGAGLVSVTAGPILFMLNALAGFLGGAQFSLANRMYLDVQPESSGTAGALYAADLAGAFAAASLISVVLLPALGIVQTCLLVAILKAGSLALVVTMRARR